MASLWWAPFQTFEPRFGRITQGILKEEGSRWQVEKHKTDKSKVDIFWTKFDIITRSNAPQLLIKVHPKNKLVIYQWKVHELNFF